MQTDAFFATHPVFTLAEAVSALAPHKDPRSTVDRLKYHVQRQALKQVTRGVYAVVPPGQDPRRFHPDPFLVGLALRPDAVFSHHSALELLGTAHSVWNAVTLFSKRRRASLTREGIHFRVLQAPKQMMLPGGKTIGTRSIERRGRLLVVTGPERTLAEGFRKLALVGGIEEILTSARGFPVLDLKLLTEILERYGMARLWAATGWFLERYQREFRVPEDVLAHCEQNKPSSPLYMERSARGGTLTTRWNLIVPESLNSSPVPNEP